MNKKMTPRAILIIAVESFIAIIAITVLGGAVITHGEFKATAYTAAAPSNDVGSSEVNTTNNNLGSSDNTVQAIAQGSYEYSYAGFNPEIVDTSVDLSELVINANYALPADYTPKLASAIAGSSVKLDYRVAPYYQAMYDSAKTYGIKINPMSGYRSYEEQKANFDDKIKEYTDAGMNKEEATKEAAKTIMIPGSSEHNAGLAVDICSMSASFENTDEFKWLQEHAADFGFILRYPKSEDAQKITGVSFEPWHYRFVGVEVAKKLSKNGKTLEKYVGVDK